MNYQMAKNPMAENNKDYSRLIKLGDMMGDGMHHEEPWISREYTRELKALEPEMFAEQRRERNKKLDIAVKEYLTKNTPACTCGGLLKQSRSGTVVLVCTCGKKYKIRKQKKL